MKNDLSIIKKDVIKLLFKNMNEQQQQAIFHVNGPLLILAGAGSGKTTVIVNRIMFLVEYGDCYYSGDCSDSDINFLSTINDSNLTTDNVAKLKSILSHNPINPWNILAITFTNKAANELKERLFNMLGEKAYDLNTGTFHSICVRILRKNIDRLGYSNSFNIYDTDDSLRVLKECFTELNINEKLFPVKNVLREVGSAKDKLIDVKSYKVNVANDFRKKVVADLYERYQNKLMISNALDFDDIIFLTVKLFTEHSDVLEYYQNRFKYIMVDEYQDTNYAQYKLVSLLAQKSQNLCVVGDDDQSIYAFRGATIDNILNFENQFSDCRVIKLEKNYRSTQNILDLANNVIKNNYGRKNKNLWTDGDRGEKVALYKCNDDNEEAEYISKIIAENIKKGMKYADHAILYRMNIQSANMERFFIRSGIPYKIIGGLKFFERKEVKDIIAYLSFINNNNDNIRLKRIINEPKRGIGATTVNLIHNLSESNNISMYDVIRDCHNYPELSKKTNVLLNFKNIVDELSNVLREQNLDEIVDNVLELTGYLDYIKSLGKDGENRLENINELKSSILKYKSENQDATLAGFLEEVALYTDLNDLNQSDDNVVMMTIHSSKGLEFDTVFLLGMEENIFPRIKDTSSDFELEEERRLLYVGITRAKRKLYMTSVKMRMLFGNINKSIPSRFLKEFPENLIDTENDFSYSLSSSDYKTRSNVMYNQRENNRKLYVASSNEEIKDAKDYLAGDTVLHNIFGKGTILKVTPMANDTLVEVRFESAGVKKIMANFAKFKKI